ncbi:hypothetical protein CWR48_04915 [Oceanobacillus arenosus]|uniref:Uncharacterized protein n=1 Tax=Oceanobacillus arenosus TaxID=1229153 RepID=A0A3D8PXR7_9BACI|nr:hypothetical protein [Oceanobacillus arenosus]RDW20068.1 hypothetical protein CWR48_04915 [Oceanobacillus arenosus]
MSTTNKVGFWGIYLAARAVLITKFTVYPTTITITDTDNAGSKAYAPTSLTLNGTSIVKNKAKSVESKGNFRKTNGVVIGGMPIGFTHDFTLRTKIQITKITGSTSIQFVILNTSEG